MSQSLRLTLLVMCLPAVLLSVMLSVLTVFAVFIGQQRSDRPLLFIDQTLHFTLHDFQHRHRLTLEHNLESMPLDFRWSPDGRGFVLYTIEADGYRFYHYDLLKRHLIALDIESTQPALPSWSADSQRLVYGSDTGGLCILTLAGMQTECLHPPPVRFAAWSPDGRRIAYFAGIPTQLYVMDVAAGEAAVLAEGPETLNHAPLLWSPDSRSLIFQRRSSLRDPANDLYLIAFDASGSGVEIIAAPRNLSSDVTDDSGFTFAQNWSPDSQQFIYTTFSPAAVATGQRTIYDLYLYSIRDGTTRRITHDAAEEMSPAWSPDGRWLAYISSLNGRPTLIVRSEPDGVLLHTEPLYAYSLDWRP